MDFPGIGAASGVFRLKPVEFFEDFDGNPDVVVLKVKHGERVMNQDVCIEDEIFDGGGGSHGLRRICSRWLRERTTETCWFFSGV